MRKIKTFFIVFFSLLAVGCQKEDANSEFEEIQTEHIQEIETDVDEDIFVHVCGQVEKPGVYRLKNGSRICDAIEAAGGVTKEASQDAVNQAELLEDGQQIRVPSMEEVLDSMEGNDGLVNLNQASKEELMTLTGIGEAKAEAIIDYREAHDGFRTIEEIMEIEGIKEGIFQKIKNQIKVS